jgi:hypothetical protein
MYNIHYIDVSYFLNKYTIAVSSRRNRLDSQITAHHTLSPGPDA